MITPLPLPGFKILQIFGTDLLCAEQEQIQNQKSRQTGEKAAETGGALHSQREKKETAGTS